MCRHCHHLLRDPIRFLLVLIPWLIDSQLGLQGLSQQLLLLTVLAGTRESRRSTAGALPLKPE
jgi:hypothetical protein